MAAMTHLGIGLAAKKIAPKTPVLVLILAANLIDIIWGVFFFLGLENMPDPQKAAINYWSHSLFMSIVWSLLAGGIVFLLVKKRRPAVIFGLLVFSHWVVDFISHPMTAVFPSDAGLPLFFAGSPLVGLGVWSTQLGVTIGEYGVVVLGLVIYILTLRQLRQEKKAAALQPPA